MTRILTILTTVVEEPDFTGTSVLRILYQLLRQSTSPTDVYVQRLTKNLLNNHLVNHSHVTSVPCTASSSSPY